MTREELNHDKQKKIFKEENKEKRIKRIKSFFKFSFYLLIISTCIFLYITYISTSKIIVKEKRIINEKIPSSFNGTKIIQFSDLHYGSTMFYDDLKKLVALINERKPDLVVFTGDLISKNKKLTTKEQEKITTLLSQIDTTLGKYAILGNEDTENILTIYNQSNFTVLNNDYDLIYKNDNNSILLTGTSTTNLANIDKSFAYLTDPTHNSNIFTLALIHEPDLTSNILEKYNVDLILAGHSHNGNIIIPFLGPLYHPKGAKEYIDEYYKIDNTQLFISSGLGTTNVNIRLFCRPSINFFRLSNK